VSVGECFPMIRRIAVPSECLYLVSQYHSATSHVTYYYYCSSDTSGVQDVCNLEILGIIQGYGGNQEYQIEKTPVGGSYDED